MHKEHDTYALMEDKRFVYNLMVVSKNHNNKPIEEFILVSPAPVDTAAKLSNIFIVMSTKVNIYFQLKSNHFDAFILNGCSFFIYLRNRKKNVQKT